MSHAIEINMISWYADNSQYNSIPSNTANTVLLIIYISLGCIAPQYVPPVNEYIDGLVQDCSISIANALRILHSCSKPSIYSSIGIFHWIILAELNNTFFCNVQKDVLLQAFYNIAKYCEHRGVWSQTLLLSQAGARSFTASLQRNYYGLTDTEETWPKREIYCNVTAANNNCGQKWIFNYIIQYSVRV